ncbi:hypothetical protein SISSUDRAFT_1041263 [Sistotremastrum suecicum HHB10207 ss-3]|uniref:DUF6534 domain-containing protein n=1 Tax=Sistotremastrum suecicum HHB10207 ss-3 TaxID=1314776 RepID=A0A166HFA6_9AGAM|nr:hypothetical protein SISSUDRAFT_1041263 [Sistotremastrum suecicum HHB10207 ss-3]
MSSLDSTFGAVLLALVFSAVLFGLTTLQTYLYFNRFPHDARWMKGLVATIWCLDALHVALCTHTIYHYLIVNYGNSDALLTEVWSLAIQTDCNGLIGMMVECFFARRVLKLSGNRYITTLIIVLAFIHFGLGVYFTVEAFVLKDFSQFAKLTWVTCTGLGSAAAADITIAVSLVYTLQKIRTGMARTDNVITTLIVYAINTGALTSMFATVCVFCYAFMPTNFVWLAFFWVLGKLYANSLLATLNSREALRGKGKTDEGTVILPMSQLTSSRSHKIPTFNTSNGGGVRINVHTTTQTISDYREAAKDFESSTPSTNSTSKQVDFQSIPATRSLEKDDEDSFEDRRTSRQWEY